MILLVVNVIVHLWYIIWYFVSNHWCVGSCLVVLSASLFRFELPLGCAVFLFRPFQVKIFTLSRFACRQDSVGFAFHSFDFIQNLLGFREVNPAFPANDVNISLFKVIIPDIILVCIWKFRLAPSFSHCLFEICREAVEFLNENKLDHWFKPNLTIKNWVVWWPYLRDVI